MDIGKGVNSGEKNNRIKGDGQVVNPWKIIELKGRGWTLDKGVNSGKIIELKGMDIRNLVNL